MEAKQDPWESEVRNRNWTRNKNRIKLEIEVKQEPWESDVRKRNRSRN
jgi:hypothetical protein